MAAKLLALHDMHVHSLLSPCSNDPVQNPGTMLDWAANQGLKTIAITDHYWDDTIPGVVDWYKGQNRAKLDRIRDMIPGDTQGVRLLVGCETEYLGGSRVGLSPSEAERMDFINLPIGHFHMPFVRPAHINTPKAVAALWLERFEQALALKLPWQKVAFAHLNDLLGFGDVLEDILRLLPEDALKLRFDRCANLGAKVELNGSSLSGASYIRRRESHLRLLAIARDCGCCFTLGSDAHHPAGLPRLYAALDAAKILGLTDAQIFDPAVLTPQ